MAYDFQLRGSSAGTTLNPDRGVRKIRVVNIGSALWDLAENALALYRLSG